MLDQIDEQVLGFRRTAHHRFLRESGVWEGLRIECEGRMAGYAYVAPDGHIGPLAVAPTAEPAAVVGAAVRAALRRQPNQISMITPGRAEAVFRALTDWGFRIEEPMVLMSAREFGNWRNYLPANPAFM